MNESRIIRHDRLAISRKRTAALKIPARSGRWVDKISERRLNRHQSAAARVEKDAKRRQPGWHNEVRNLTITQRRSGRTWMYERA